MHTVVVSVPGKVHLMGEHAIVYGKPALLAAVNLRLTVSIEEIAFPNAGELVEIVSTEPVDHARFAVGYLTDTLGISIRTPIRVIIKSEIPAGYHLGSSAAVAVGLSGAVMYFYKKLWNPQRINELAYEIEKKQHGNPSGGDNTTVTVGGFVWFRKELEFLKSIWQLPFKPHGSLDHFFLINTGRPKESTGEMVALVKERYGNNSGKMRELFDLNEQQVKRVTVALKEGTEADLIEALRIGEKTLEGMGVVSQKVAPLIRSIEKAGGAAKILGGGGSKEGVGFLLCYHKDLQTVNRICRTYGFSTLSIKLGEEGIRLEKK